MFRSITELVLRSKKGRPPSAPSYFLVQWQDLYSRRKIMNSAPATREIFFPLPKQRQWLRYYRNMFFFSTFSIFFSLFSFLMHIFLFIFFLSPRFLSYIPIFSFRLQPPPPPPQRNQVNVFRGRAFPPEEGDIFSCISLSLFFFVFLFSFLLV